MLSMDDMPGEDRGAYERAMSYLEVAAIACVIVALVLGCALAFRDCEAPSDAPVASPGSFGYDPPCAKCAEAGGHQPCWLGTCDKCTTDCCKDGQDRCCCLHTDACTCGDPTAAEGIAARNSDAPMGIAARN